MSFMNEEFPVSASHKLALTTSLPFVHTAQNLTEWTDKFEEIGHKAETLAFSPSKVTFEMLSKSHAQLESTLRKAIDQQQKNRAEVLDAIGGYVDQLKQTQSGVLKTFELYNPLIAK